MGRECHRCHEWIEEGQRHDCWTTTEAALTEDLAEDLRDAWERLRETAVEFGDQRIYASGTSIMFSRDRCYFFVRPRRTHLQVCVFLGRAVRAPQVRRIERTSRFKLLHIVHIRHRDEVEAPITEWLREAYGLPERLAAEQASSGERDEAARRRRRPRASTATRRNQMRQRPRRRRR